MPQLCWAESRTIAIRQAANYNFSYNSEYRIMTGSAIGTIVRAYKINIILARMLQSTIATTFDSSSKAAKQGATKRHGSE
jgi:hypothetical protein